MLGNRRLGQSDLVHDIAANAGLIFGQQADDMDARRVTQRLGDGGQLLGGCCVLAWQGPVMRSFFVVVDIATPYIDIRR